MVDEKKDLEKPSLLEDKDSENTTTKVRRNYTGFNLNNPEHVKAANDLLEYVED